MPSARFFAATILGSVLLASVTVDGAPARARRIVVRQRAPMEVGARIELGERGLLPLVAQRLSIHVEGQHAQTTSNLEFHNRTEDRVEGFTRIEIDERARVTAFSYWNGAERIVGEVLPKATARAIYDETVGRGRDPGLLEEIGPGRYSLDVFPIERGEHKRVQIEWAQWLEQHAGEVVYRAPLADPNAELVIELDDDRGITDVRSSSHELKVRREGGHTRVTAKPHKKHTKSIELRWRVEAPPLTMHAWVHRVPKDDGYVVMHVAAPPLDPKNRVAKDVTLVIDESGSMSGEALDNSKLAARQIVERLEGGDRINVVLFDDRAEALFDAPKPIDATVREKTQRFIAAAGDGGGTDIALALRTALDRQGTDERPKTILLLTDGQSDADAVFAAAKADTSDVRVFPIGVGEGVDHAVLERLAATKRGRYTEIPDAQQIGGQVTRLFGRMQAPVLVDLELESNGPTLMRTYPETLPDLFAGDEIVIAARVQGTGLLDVRLNGRARSGTQTIVHNLRIPKSEPRMWVGAMWARARIDDLLTRMALEQEDREERIDEVTRLGVAYDLVTPYTSFLAIPEAELTERTRALREQGRTGERTSVGREVSMEEFRNIPLSGRARDFSGVVESSASEDAAVNHAAANHAVSEEPPTSSGRAGCAHCAVGDEADATPWLFAFVLMVLRRRSHLVASTNG